MRGIQSDQKKAVDSSHLKAVESAPNALDLPTDPVPRSSIRSKVFDEDPTDAVGTGMVPWLVLVAAIVALGLWFLL